MWQIIDDQDQVIEIDLTLAQAEYLLCWHINCGAEVWLQEMEK